MKTAAVLRYEIREIVGGWDSVESYPWYQIPREGAVCSCLIGQRLHIGLVGSEFHLNITLLKDRLFCEKVISWNDQ